MDLFKAQTLAKELMELHGVTQMGYRFAFNNRRNSAGVCNYNKKMIFLSMLLTKHTDEEEVRDTILHEIAHALTKGHGHDNVWKRKAIEIGCNGNRCYSSNTKESTYNAFKKVAKYKGLCPNGHERFKNRFPKRKSSCGECCPIYNEKYLITYTKVL